MTKKLHAYDLELIDTLKSTYKPYATKCAYILEDKDIPKVDSYRAIINTLIKLEELLEQSQKKVIEYKNHITICKKCSKINK